MKYTVVWQRWAEDELTEIWLAASSDERASITEAANSIELFLRYDAYLVGESRSENTRIVIVSSLAVTFDVRHDDRIVDIYAVHGLPAAQDG